MDGMDRFLLLCASCDVCAITFREAQFLSDSACDLGGGGVAVEVHLIHTVPVHVAPAQFQTVDSLGTVAQ